jgi:predicted transcriptional regulator YdeE
MAKIIKVENEELRYTRIVGKKYNGGENIPQLWNKWFEQDGFSYLNSIKKEELEDSYLGVMIWKQGEHQFDYYIAAFVPDDYVLPVGFDELRLPTRMSRTYFIQGVDGPSLYDQEGNCFQEFKAAKEALYVDENGYSYAIERYACPRFTTPNEKNEVILDYCLLRK